MTCRFGPPKPGVQGDDEQGTPAGTGKSHEILGFSAWKAVRDVRETDRFELRDELAHW